MIPACVNDGGAASLVQLEALPPLDEPVVLTAQALAALGRWQPRLGEIYTVVDPYRTFYRARLIEWTPEKGVVIPFQRLSRPVESPVAVEVYQALPEKERFELILQKLTEIGAARIVPYTSQRSTTVEERDAGQKKSHRWPQVILRAARQCRRGTLPELYPVLSWEQATSLAASADLKLLLFEGEAPWSLREALRNERPSRVALVVGPEGGFAPEEVEAARNLGFLPVCVGPRLLRTETAAMVGAALVQYELGDLG